MEESKNLADGIKAVSEQYDVLISGKQAAWMNLALVAGMVYIPRAFVAIERLRLERIKLEKQETRPLVVHQDTAQKKDLKDLSEDEKLIVEQNAQIRAEGIQDLSGGGI